MSRDGAPGPTEGMPLSVASPFVPVAVDANTVQFRIGPLAGPAYTLHDSDADGCIANLVELLDGRNTRSEVLEAFDPRDRPNVASVLDRLQEERVVVETDGDPSTSPGGVITPGRSIVSGEVERVDDSTVLVINVGAIGRHVVEDLLALEAEDVRLLEPVRGVERNGIDDAAVTVVDSDADVETEVSAADCVVYASTEPRPELANTVNEAAFESSVPWVTGRLCGFDGFVGPAVIPGRTACFACYRSRLLGAVDDPDAYRRFEADVDTVGPRRSVPSLARVVAGFLSIDLLHLLLDGVGYTAGSVVHFDFFDLTVESNTVLKRPRCEVCGGAGRDTLDVKRHLDLDDLLGG